MFDFSDQSLSSGNSYLQTCGLSQGVTFQEAVYEANEKGEWITLKFDVNGSIFTDRCFGTSVERVFTKNIYEDGKIVRSETKEEAYQRYYRELYQKLAYLAMCYLPEADVHAGMGKFDSLKGLAEGFNKTISGGDLSTKLNILTVWKNNDNTQRSNLIIPERTKWVEVTQYDALGTIAPAKIKLSAWQLNNLTTERYPYNGTSAEASSTTDAIINSVDASDDLPF